MTRYVVLLRGINVGGNRKLPMAELRALCADEGFSEVATYIQSGNVVLTSDRPATEVAERLERAIAARFGFEVPVIVRTTAQWLAYAAGSPFADAQAERPKILHLCLCAGTPATGAAEAIAARAQGGERVTASGDALWVDFADNIARTKLTPSVLDRAAGSPVTARNWNSVLALAAMLNLEAEE